MDAILPAIQAKTKLYLHGPYGSGKTGLAIERVRWLLRQERVRGDDILVLVPQRTVALPYLAALRGPDAPPGSPVRITTLSGLARNAIELYWPLLAGSAGFTDPDREPTFLNLETAQYRMAPLVDVALNNREFEGVRVQRSRIISQILDNLNKAALHGFTIDEAYDRLELAAPPGEHRAGQLNALNAARHISHEFRQLCYDQTLIDFSLQIDLFSRQLLTNQWSRTHLLRSHRHLIYDNAEEGNAAAHDLVRLWLPDLDSALIVVDEDGGYRLFLGADPNGALELAKLCTHQRRVVSPDGEATPIRNTIAAVERALRRPTAAENPPVVPADGDERRLAFRAPEVRFRFYPQMIAWVVSEIRRLVTRDGMRPGEIAVVAPFVSDALRFALQTGLEDAGIPTTSHRPSRALEDEPAAKCLLTLAALAHPEWGMRPQQSEVILALVIGIAAMDPVRANLLAEIVYPSRRQTIELGRFGALNTRAQERITFTVGEAYERLRGWLYDYRAEAEPLPLDQFLARLFGEVLSQPGFGFHADYDAARVANQLVESARNFRWALEEAAANAPPDVALGVRLGRDYLNLVSRGALGALYIPGWQPREDAVFISPAYTFLMRNRTVDVQFWLDIGSDGWWERLYQPLTHPYVLARGWPANRPWTDLDEYQARQDVMRRLMLGLLRRARNEVYLGLSEFSESGMEQRGALLNLVNRLLAFAAPAQ
jgi:hypothetical protein